MRPEIDVIVTNYNYQQYLEESIASALDQDGVRTHVVLVDDASTEPLPDWIERTTAVRVIRRPVRGGQGASFNTGVAFGGSELVAFLDADDLWPSYRCQALAEAIVDKDLAHGTQITFNDGHRPEIRLTAKQREVLPRGQAGLIAGTVMMRRALLQCKGAFAENTLTAFIEWVARARQTDPAPQEVAIDVPVLLRRAHPRNLSRSGSVHTNYLQTIRALRNLP